MVVDLAIEDHKYRVILIRHRLIASSKIDNRKTLVSEENMRGLVFIYAFAVGPSVVKDPCHRNQIAAVSRTNKTGNATHRCYLCSGEIDELADAIGAATLAFEVSAHQHFCQ